MTQVVLEDITKDFGSVKVIHGVSVEIADGEFVALVGPSGSGKSTVLRMIAGLEDPSSGAIRIGDRVVNDVLPKDRDIAMVFQSYALYPHMNVRENMSFSLELQKRPKAEIDKAVAEAADILALTDYLDRKPKQLSGGQRQRVAMGRAIVRHPGVFLFDEPLSNLDAKLRTVMRKEVKLLHQRLQSTSVYVTHDQTEAMTMADKIVVMNHGRIEQVGSPMELYNKPQNLFVAGFIGTPQMNFIEGHVSESGSFVPEGMSDTSMSLPTGFNSHSDETLILALRPEHLIIEASGPHAAKIELVEPLGSETLLTCRFGSTELRIIDRSMGNFRQGEEIRFGYDVGLAHLFSKESGLRL